MQTEQTSAIIAHFIGEFDAPTEAARLRIHHTEGKVETGDALPEDSALPSGPNFASSLALEDYDPGVEYRAPAEDISGPPLRYPVGSPHTTRSSEPDDDFSGRAQPRRPEGPGGSEPDQKLLVDVGPGSTASHMSQVNLLQDDDHLDMTGDHHPRLDFSETVVRAVEYADEAAVFTPFSDAQRTDSYEGLTELADEIRDFAATLPEQGATGFHEDAEVDFAETGEEITGIRVNGETVEAAPKLADYLPDRGLAAPAKEPAPAEDPLAADPADPTPAATDANLAAGSGLTPPTTEVKPAEGPLVEEGGPTDTLKVEAGANLVANLAIVTDTGVIAPVMSVMGDYHQVDVITQAWVYSDDDTVDAAFALSASKEAGTVAMNVAAFQRTSFTTPEEEKGDATAAKPEPPPVFPQYWRVSEIDGDVSFVKWIEQYNFVTDNDRLVVTTTGTQTTVLSGGNTAIDFTSFLGISKAYDLVIVGGDVLDMNVISQLAVLYDNDWVVGGGGTAGAVSVSTSGNLLWNQATITNIGLNDRFEDMPAYMKATQKAIEARDAAMPEGLATDPGFAGQQVLDVLYIVGNLFDVTYIKQVNVLGDADHVTLAASDYLAATSGAASVTIATGGNAVVNIAQIVDYDTFGETTYLAGKLYSDAVLIQGGIIEHDDTQPQVVDLRLANEVIAFLDSDAGAEAPGEAVINGGQDLSWALASPADAMQTVIA